MAIVINFFGGPGSGKSTWASYLFSFLKSVTSVKCELVTEFAKDLTYKGDLETLSKNWPLILGTQLERMNLVSRHVDVIITDSPLDLTRIYGHSGIYPDECKNMLRSLKLKYELDKEVNIFVERTKEYRPYGRAQTSDESHLIARRIHTMLTDDSCLHAWVTSDVRFSKAERIYRDFIIPNLIPKEV